MKENPKILFISQEINPYLAENERSVLGRILPQTAQENGYETRTFMPKFGEVNERRNQLHEVIRLSGMNLIIDDTDHPLIIKVASIQSARIQVYFIDNEDYFRRRTPFVDENGKEYADNDERSIFFVRGVLETVKKLRWTPDIIHCQGWMTALAPLYIKRGYHDDPFFRDSKVIFSVFDQEIQQPFNANFSEKLMIDGVQDADVAGIKGKKVDFEKLMGLALDFSDGVVAASPTINTKVQKYITDKKIPFLDYPGEDGKQKYIDFYNTFL